jgi:two-component system response regulator LytT
MPGISGIDLKKEVLRQDKIARIVFVTNHNESIYNTFSKKTIGFIPKSPSQEKIKKMLIITLDEIEENIAIKIKDYDGKLTEIYMEDIVFLKASGSYTEIITKTSEEGLGEFILSTKKIGELEKEMWIYPIIRVHKSYMVNLASVIKFGEKILLQNLSMEIPVGRRYKEKAKTKYLQYVKNRIKKRL